MFSYSFLQKTLYDGDGVFPSYWKYSVPNANSSQHHTYQEHIKTVYCTKPAIIVRACLWSQFSSIVNCRLAELLRLCLKWKSTKGFAIVFKSSKHKINEWAQLWESTQEGLSFKYSLPGSKLIFLLFYWL